MNIELEEPMDSYEPSARRPGAVKKNVSPQKNYKKNAKQPQKKNTDVFATVIRRFRKNASLNVIQDIIRLLTPYIEDNPEHIPARKILIWCLITDQQYREAGMHLKDLLNINRNDTECLNAMAYLSLADGRLEDAVNYLLDAVYIDSKNNQLKTNLEKLRKIKDPVVFFKMTPPADFLVFNLPQETVFDRLLAAISGFLSLRQIRPVIYLALTAGFFFILYLIWPFLVTITDEYRFKRGLGRGRVTHITIQDIDRIVAERQKYSLKMSEDEIKRKFEMIKSYIEEKKPNRAMITVNELLNSNASDFIKERVGILKDFIPDPTAENIDYNPPVQEVIKTPFLYQDVTIRWSGTIANLEHKDREETAFDLLINFVEEAVVEGIASCHYKGFEKILSGEKIAVYGKIAGISIDNKVIIKGKEIQRIGR